MKKMIAYCSMLALCAMLSVYTVGHAQIAPIDTNAPKELTDSTMGKRLANDWNTRNPELKNQSVDWFYTHDGYLGTYAIDSIDYMSRYDKMGNYIETMNRKEWDEMIPRSVKSAFDNSMYKSQEVTGYWEVSDPFRKGYYMELKDSQERVTRVWADENNKYTTKPYTRKPNK